MTAPDDETLRETLHRAMNWAEAPAGTCASCRAPATHWAVGPDGTYVLYRYCIDHAFEAVGAAETPGRWTVRAIPGASQALALAAEVLRLRAERDALRGIVVRLAGDDGMYSDDYGMHCLCGFKRDHGDGCLRAEAQALLGGER